MGRFLILTAAAGLLAAAVAAEEPKDPKAEWPAKREALNAKLAVRHAGLGLLCRNKKLHEIAWREYRRASQCDPKNAEAQRALGRKQEGDGWVDDPKAQVKKRNEGMPDTWKPALDEYAKKRDAAAASSTKDLETLATWAAKAGLEAEAKALWKELVAWYAPEHEKAHLALGDLKDQGEWVRKMDADARAEAAKRILSADPGKAVTEKSELERVTGWTLAKRQSAHFKFEGKCSDAQMGELIRTAEALRTWFFEEFKLDQADAFVIEGYLLSTHGEYSTYIDCVPGKTDAERKEAKSYGNYAFYQPTRFVAWGTDTRFLQDLTVHRICHFSSYRILTTAKEVPPWFIEGLAYWFTDRLLKSAQVYCVNLGTGDGSRDLKNPLVWRRALADGLREGRDPDMREVLAVGYNGLTGLKVVKAWSIVDWLMTSKKQALHEIISDLNNGVSQEESLKARLEVKGYEELDERWEAWFAENN